MNLIVPIIAPPPLVSQSMGHLADCSELSPHRDTEWCVGDVPYAIALARKYRSCRSAVGWLVAGICLLANCNQYPCLIDNTSIVVDANTVSSVPDQILGGCYSITIDRGSAVSAQRELILRAESLPSTVGPTWHSATRNPDVYGFAAYPDVPIVLIPDALNADALIYYTSRMRSFQKGELVGVSQAQLYYVASVDDPQNTTPSNPDQSTTVHLLLHYSESWGPYFLQGGFGIIAVRDVVFDEDGNVVEISGDGGALSIIP